MKKCAWVLVVAMLSGAWFWAKPVETLRAQGNPPVQMIPPGQQQASSPGDKGATYYALESQTVKLTTTFRDGGVAVAERALTGEVKTTIRDANGNERGHLRVFPIDRSRDMVRFESTGGTSFQALADPGVSRHTLDWSTTQAYGLVKDGTDNLVWDAGLMRPKGAQRRDVDGDIDAVETTWANGVVATLAKRDLPPHEIARGRVVQGRAWDTTLSVNGASAGRSMWFERDQVFAYHLPALMDHLVWIGPEHLKAQYGGWPFKPDTAWLNLQTIAAYHFRTNIAKQGFVARACDTPQPNRLVQFFMPTLHANEPGCDGLHWLDGSLLRQCCDDHDRCYSRNGCTSQSWWRVWTSWTCDFCNMAVVACFAVGADNDPCRNRSWWSC